MLWIPDISAVAYISAMLVSWSVLNAYQVQMQRVRYSGSVVMDLIFASAGIDVPCSAEIGRCRSYRQQTIIEVPFAAAAAFHTTRRRLKRVL